jgi:hypothetical protein
MQLQLPHGTTSRATERPALYGRAFCLLGSGCIPSTNGTRHLRRAGGDTPSVPQFRGPRTARIQSYARISSCTKACRFTALRVADP